MTNYPNSQDNNITLPAVSGSTDEDIAINALRDATFAIEKELGNTPSGVYSDVRARFDILEARINNPVSPTILSDGYVNSPLFIVNTPDAVTLSISDGYGVPTENRVDGSIYMRSNGAANAELYVRRGGAWFPLQSDLWVAGGDLSGTYTSQTVIGMRGKALNVSLASVGATQDGYHLTWNNSGNYWEAQTGFRAGGDLAALSGPFGRVTQTVVRLQNRVLSSAAPGGTTASNGDALVWNTIDSQWQPQTRAVIFDGYTGRTNLRSNKNAQSPIDTSKTGIVNFGSRSTGSTTGATENYAAILSGDRGTVSGNFGLIVGGDSHTVTGQYGTVVNGLTNTASAQYAAVLSGTANQATQTYAFVLDGYSNVASAVNSFVLGGANNAPAANYSGVLHGIGNTIASGSVHAGIGFGSSNAIGASSTYTIVLGGSGNTATGQNILLGNPTGANVHSNYTTVLSGLNNTVAAASNYAFIGSGATNSVTGIHATVINGNTNSVNGAYSGIFDGYSNTVSGSGSLILDGYSNTVSGYYSSVLNGNNNNIASRNSTVLNGSLNIINALSAESTIFNGTGNSFTTTTNGLISGNGNLLTSANNSLVIGTFNTVQSASSIVLGNTNNLAGSSANRVFGSSNTLSATTSQSAIFGDSNQVLNTSSANLVVGSANIVDTSVGSHILGSTNRVTGNLGFVHGQYGWSRMFNQNVQSNSRFTAGRYGEAQFSRLVLTGTATGGSAINLQLQDSSPTNPTFVDGYSYDMQIRVLVVNTSPISPNPVVPARFVFDVLAHQEGGTIVIDNVNQTLMTPNTSDDPTGATRTIGWSVTISNTGSQLTVTVNPETSSANYVQPTNTPSTRRAVATIEMREITRL